MLKEVIENVAKAKSYDLSTVDWAGKITAEVMANAVKLGLKRSTGNVCSGQDDFELVVSLPSALSTACFSSSHEVS